MKKLFTLTIIVAALAVLVLPVWAATYSSSVDSSDPLQTGRLFRNGIPSACGSSKPNPGPFSATPRHYEVYTYTNTNSVAECITVTLSGSFDVFSVAYLGSFNPANVSANYLADAGSSGSTSYGFTLQPGATAQIVVNDVFGSAASSPQPYTLTIMPDRSGPDMVYIPPEAVVGAFVKNCAVHWAPNASSVTDVVMEAGKTAWVYGLDENSAYYQVMLSGQFFWVPTSCMGPNYDEVWNGTPLPTTVINAAENSVTEGSGSSD